MKMHTFGRAVVLALLLPLVGCADEAVAETLPDEELAEEVPAAPGPAAAVTEPIGEIEVADIVADSASYVGRTVTVVADVEEVFGPMMFTLDEDAVLAGGVDDDLLVLSDKAANLGAIDDQWLDNKVRVTGTVRNVTIIDLERQIGWDLDPEFEIELEGREAVLVATALERVED